MYRIVVMVGDFYFGVDEFFNMCLYKLFNGNLSFICSEIGEYIRNMK